jgi:uncharacterized protein YndB with AHSA1/START domain
MNKAHSLTVKKLIRASRDRVFAAWTKPELMRKWFFPEGMGLVSSEADVRVGGQFRAAMSDGSQTYTALGTYREIEVGRKLVFSHSWLERDPLETEVTVEFTDQDGGTLVTVTHEGLGSEASAKGHEGGWLGTLENLAKFLSDPPRSAA